MNTLVDTLRKKSVRIRSYSGLYFRAFEQYLALEVFKSLMHLNPEFMWSYFNENPIPYDLRKGIKVFLPPVKSFRFGLNSIHFRGSILWNNLPSSIKNSLTINEFKVKLKNLRNIHCTYGVCR